MLTWNLHAIFKARGIKRPYTFMVKAGLSPNSATSLLNNTSRSVRLDHVEILCEKLYCFPGDLMKWSPRKENPLPDSHPLRKLENLPAGFDLSETLKNIPLDKLNEIKTLLSGNHQPNP
jgi:DNA-binding Xre family transcriptional regulator